MVTFKHLKMIMQLCDHVTVSFVLYIHILKSSFKLVFSQLIVSAASTFSIFSTSSYL